MDLVKDLDRLMIIFLLWNSALSFGYYLLFPAFLAFGFSILDILILLFLNYFIPLIMLLFPRGYLSHRDMFLGVLFVALGFLAFITLKDWYGSFLMYLLGALAFPLFWIPFNSLWFELSGKGKAGHSSVYYIVITLLAVISPAVSGFVAQSFGFDSVFFVTILLLLLTSLCALSLSPKREASFGFFESLKLTKGFRTLLFIEGLFTIGPVVIASIISLKYFPKPVDFGLFISLATVLSCVSSFLIAKMSDSSGRRREFILLSAIGAGVSLIFAASVNDAFWWFVALSLINFFKTIFLPFPIALILDSRRSIPEIVFAREIMLGLGRSAAMALAIFIYFYSESLSITLALLGISMLVYAGIFEFLKKNKIAPSKFT